MEINHSDGEALGTRLAIIKYAMVAKSGEKGFTLVELLVVVGIVSILASIAMTQYAGYKQKAVDAAMMSALHNARQSMEALFAGSQPESYVTATVPLLVSDFGYQPASGITLMIVTKTDFDYSLRVCARGGTTPAFFFNSNAGAMVPGAGFCT